MQLTFFSVCMISMIRLFKLIHSTQVNITYKSPQNRSDVFLISAIESYVDLSFWTIVKSTIAFVSVCFSNMRIFFKKSRFWFIIVSEFRFFKKPRFSSLHEGIKKFSDSMNFNASCRNLRNSSFEEDIYSTNVENYETFGLRNINTPKNLHKRSLIL